MIARKEDRRPAGALRFVPNRPDLAPGGSRLFLAVPSGPK